MKKTAWIYTTRGSLKRVFNTGNSIQNNEAPIRFRMFKERVEIDPMIETKILEPKTKTQLIVDSIMQEFGEWK
jgi:hypothetical protein